MNWIRRYWNFICTWRKHRQIIKDLNTLTNLQLKDIGLNRGDIDRLVWHPEDLKKRGK